MNSDRLNHILFQLSAVVDSLKAELEAMPQVEQSVIQAVVKQAMALSSIAKGKVGEK